MKLIDLLLFSTNNLRRRKGRTALTIIGVVVGVCAIVVMISLGIAVNRATDEMLRGYGDLTKITVYKWGAEQGTPDLDDKMVEQFKALPGVVAATPILQPNFYGEICAGRNAKYRGYSTPLGMDVESIANMGYTLLTGDYLSGQSFGRNKIPVLVEAQAMFNFYDSSKNWTHPNYQKYAQWDETGMSITNMPRFDEDGNLLNPEDFFFDITKTQLIYQMQYGWDETTNEPKYVEYELIVVGVIQTDINNWPVTGGIIMSIADVQKLQKEYNKLSGNSSGGRYASSIGQTGGTIEVGGYDNVYLKIVDVEHMSEVEKAIKAVGYQIDSMSQLREQMQGQVAQTQMMLGGLAAVSLFVAALNIMNTMTMAIYERTKEIGVMKVLGCKLPNIRTLFLVESGSIGLLGGIIGCGVSMLLGILLNYLPHIMSFLGIDGNVDMASIFGLGGLSSMMPGMKISVIPLWLILMALGFATLVGLLSGIAPANRAMKISSLEAIRHE
ncbi:MAG: ABC transporter permease [Clostridiales Family XIII bacterium]|jgi:ABC-type antimicrobial peptide transport system permease subunit|nr:ABC transporter permease [Clostridiales Family XIII bacterium]